MSGTDNQLARVEFVMGMPVSIHLRGPAPEARRQAAMEAVFAHLRAVDRTFSTYRQDSEISRLARGELSVDACSPQVREVLDGCNQARIATGGYFDPMLPSAGGGRTLDPSGLVKGWAVERAARLLAELDREDYYLNAGGDIALRCARPDSPPWRIGIEDPRRTDRMIAILPLRTGGVATSGTAHRGAHISDPRTGSPATGLRSVTVTGPSLLWADVYATAAFARGRDAPDWLATLTGYASLVVREDGTLWSSTTMGRLLTEKRPTPSAA